ncbi:ribonuclease Z [Portibacter lacus]|uniref:Ribonuclease Z n=1 Tax=Portibacter lacus TaxID=1099794 RepID=A0AA37SL00_9BACT|nr:ribonuclease Z [Portibacter lacus]GLR16111.1 ribonuclease Z [Portibacter lacus]
MSLTLTILGCNSAVPTLSRFTTSQALQNSSKTYLIDCGEGAQIRLKDLKIKRTKIHEIFISHLHGDHFFGLPGLITSLNLSGRLTPLTIYGPAGLSKFIHTLKEIGSIYLNFELIIHELQADVFQKVFEDQYLEVYSIPLKHRIPTTGFLFKEKEHPRNILPPSIKKHKLSIEEIKTLKNSKDVTRPDGSTLYYMDHTIIANKAESYAFCSDTIYDEELIQYIQNVDLLYHEATYLHELKTKARERGHATAHEAALIAQKSGAKKLILGHYSSRYKDLSVFIDEAEKIFSNVDLALDGKVFQVSEH